jgi:hypothetical protein
MPVRMINFLQTPPPPKMMNRILEGTDEWQDFIMSLGAGLKPQEYLSISFPPEHRIWKALKFPNSAFVTNARKRIKKLQLPYDVYERGGVVYVVGRSSVS